MAPVVVGERLRLGEHGAPAGRVGDPVTQRPLVEAAVPVVVGVAEVEALAVGAEGGAQQAPLAFCGGVVADVDDGLNRGPSPPSRGRTKPVRSTTWSVPVVGSTITSTGSSAVATSVRVRSRAASDAAVGAGTVVEVVSSGDVCSGAEELVVVGAATVP